MICYYVFMILPPNFTLTDLTNDFLIKKCTYCDSPRSPCKIAFCQWIYPTKFPYTLQEENFHWNINFAIWPNIKI